MWLTNLKEDLQSLVKSQFTLLASYISSKVTLSNHGKVYFLFSV